MRYLFRLLLFLCLPIAAAAGISVRVAVNSDNTTFTLYRAGDKP